MEPYERLDEAMNQRRLQLRMNWRQVAEAADMSYTALRAIRRGEYRPAELTARALDDVLQWTHGSVYAVLAGRDPVPVETQAAEASQGCGSGAPAAESPSTVRPTLSSRELGILQDLIEVTAARLGLSPEEADEAYRRARLKIEGQRAAEERNDPPVAPRRGRTAS
ncbi:MULTISPECIES: helix-turn-helix transcriptional regulator [unclassified Streptomyces]|uniref:helix-turn-helix domain-containing protein n=1 Tax=unclassified Streptomyces TaxID=2593676 RepID=UPI001CD527EE|nr:MULTISPECIES: helix-turn-helix transcriptional regulator [unclassified Streptomyces]